MIGRGKRGSGRGPSCEAVRRRLSLLLGEDLPEGEDRRIRSHLLNCRDCRGELGAWMKTRKQLASMVPDPAGSALFFEQLHRDILLRVRDSAEETVSDQILPEPVLRWAWSKAGGVAAAVALFLIGLQIGMYGERPAAGLLGAAPISDSVPSAHDPSSPTMPVGYFGGLESLSRTVRAALERSARQEGELSRADQAEFARRFLRLCMRRTLECGEVHSSVELAAEPGDEECRQLLRRFRRECRKR